MTPMPSVPLTDCRLIVHPPAGGAWNMAVDEHLLGWTSRTGRCCWRFYQWAEPTLSLGYFQQYAARAEHEASRGCPVVRRASGGGAILHDRELTYSVTVPLDHPLGKRRQWMYDAVHQTLIAVLATKGIRASLFGSSSLGEERSAEFLCFKRRSAGDVVVAEAKIAGSAQRRSALAVLQHGSVLLCRSWAAPELPGLCEITGKTVEPEELMYLWRQQVGEALKLRWHADSLSQEEEEEVAGIVAEKYGSQSWTEKRRGS